jgi:hypothetical protein
MGGYFQHVASYDPEKGNWAYPDHIFVSLGQPSSHYRIFIDDDIWINVPAHGSVREGLSGLIRMMEHTEYTA